MKIYRIKESKTSQLKKLLSNGNITEEQFRIADEFFKKYNSFENEIDWNKGNKITWEDLSEVIYKDRSSKSQTKKKIRKGLEGFEEGKDYLVLREGTYLGKPWVAYQPFTWEASRMIASHYVEPSENNEGEIEDAGWCTAYQKDEVPWEDHNDKEAFIYICGETIPTKKVAISISKEERDASYSWFQYKIEDYDLNFNIWDFEDYNNTIHERYMSVIIPDFYFLIKEAYSNWYSTYRERLLAKLKEIPNLKYNPETNRYDYTGETLNTIYGATYPGDVSSPFLKYNRLIAPDKNGFIIDFGEIFGDFDCSGLDLISLKGAPQKVHGYFYCAENKLTSLEDAPSVVDKGFQCCKNQLTSLEGAPEEVGRWFDCSDNKLTSLKGAPKNVGGNFDCSHNKLITLEGAPDTVDGDFFCDKNPRLDSDSLEYLGEISGIIVKDF